MIDWQERRRREMRLLDALEARPPAVRQVVWTRKALRALHAIGEVVDEGSDLFLFYLRCALTCAAASNEADDDALVAVSKRLENRIQELIQKDFNGIKTEEKSVAATLNYALFATHEADTGRYPKSPDTPEGDVGRSMAGSSLHIHLTEEEISVADASGIPGSAYDLALVDGATTAQATTFKLDRLARLYERLQASPHDDVFWRQWYEGMVTGHPLDWDLQREVALIPDAEWEKGPEHIALLIGEIEARYLANVVAERIELAPSGRLTLVPQDFPKDRHLGLLIDTVRDALDLATSGLRNELPEDAYQVRLLCRTFARYGNDPQRIEMDFERARVSLIEDIAADAIPASAPNRDLVQALADAAGAIRDSDPEIAKNRERLNRIRLGQVSPEDAARIAEAAEQVAEISEGVLRDDLLEDRFRLPGVRRDTRVPDPVVPLGAAERNAALEAQAAQLRLYSRLAKVWLFLKAHHVEVGVLGALSGIIGTIATIAALFAT